MLGIDLQAWGVLSGGGATTAYAVRQEGGLCLVWSCKHKLMGAGLGVKVAKMGCLVQALFGYTTPWHFFRVFRVVLVTV